MKKTLMICLLILAVCFAATGCKSSNPVDTQPLAAVPTEEVTQPAETAAAVFENFQDISWTRDTANCTEKLRFLSDGTLTYSCTCGDPVNDADLCEGYVYDEETKVISLTFTETTEDTVTQITVQSCDGQTLVLDFAGDLRTFCAA